MSRRTNLLAVLLFGLLLVGLVALNGALFALAFPLAVYLIAALFFAPDQLAIEVSRSISKDHVLSNRAVTISLTITNKGARLDEVLVEDIIPSGLKLVEGYSKVLISLSSGQSHQLSYSYAGARGNFSLNRTLVRACESYGLYTKDTVLAAPTQLIILPELKRLHQVLIRPRRTHDYVGPIPARQGGSGVEFFGVREYQLGDPLRWVNWKVTARQDRDLIFTNEFEQERIADVGLILDARLQNDIIRGDESLFEYSVRATASLADAFLNDGNRVGLLIYGRGQEKTFPGYGKVQREHILRALGKAQTSDNLALQNLNYLPTRFFPAHSQIVMISPLADHDIPVLFQLRALGYSLLIVSPNPVLYEARGYIHTAEVNTGTRLANLERALLLHKLQRAGIQTIDWDVSRPFEQVANSTLGRMARITRNIGRVS